MAELLLLAGPVAAGFFSHLFLGGLWVSNGVPRPQIVLQYVPAILIHAAVLVVVMWLLGLRRGTLSAAKMLSVCGMLAILVFASPLVTGPSFYWEMKATVALLLLIISAAATLILLLWRNMEGLSNKVLASALAIVCSSVYFWLGLFLYDQHPPDGDEPYYLLIAHSIVYDHDIDLRNNYNNKDYSAYYPYDLQLQDRKIVIKGKEYSVPNHNIGFPLLIAAPYRLFGYRGVVALVNILAGLVVANLLLLSQRLGASRRAGFVAALTFGFLVPFINYANQVFPATCAALLVIYGFRRLLEERPGTRRDAIVLAVVFLGLFMLKLRLSLIVAPMLVLFIVRRVKRLRIWLYLGVSVAGLGVLGWIFRARFTTLRLIASRLDEMLRMHLHDLTPASGLAGQMLDQQFGLLVLAPVYLLAIVGAVRLYKADRGLLGRVALVCLPYYLAVGSVPWWNASWCPPCRFLIPILPLAGALMAIGLQELASARQLVALFFVGFWSATFTLLHLLSPAFRYDLPRGVNRAFGLLNMSSTIEIGRLFPSFFRTDVTSPLKVAGLTIGLATVLFVLLRPKTKRRRTVQMAESAVWVGPAALGLVCLFVLLSGLAIAACWFPKSVVELEDEPLSIWDPPSRTYISGARRLTPRFGFEKRVWITPGEKFILVKAMMRNPVGQTVPNLKVQFDGQDERIVAIDEPVNVEIMNEYYSRVSFRGGEYTLRCQVSLPDRDINKVDPYSLANLYVDKIEILEPNGLRAWLYRVLSYIYSPFSTRDSLELAGHGYFIQPKWHSLGQRLLKSFIDRHLWTEAADLFSYQADRDALDLSRYDDKTILSIARAELLRRRPKHAIKAARLVPKTSSSFTEARLIVAEALIAQGMIDAASQLISSVSGRVEASSLALKRDFLIGICQERKGQVHKAIEALSRVAFANGPDQFESLCHLWRLSKQLNDKKLSARVRKLMLERRTRSVPAQQMIRSGGKACQGGWVLDRNGYFETAVNGLGQVLAVRMNVKAKGTFETNIETGLVRYVWPDIRVTLDDRQPQYITIPYSQWGDSYVFFQATKPGTHRLRIEYINDHTFQKDLQNRQFFLSKVELESALVFQGREINWKLCPRGDRLVFESDVSLPFGARSLALYLAPLPKDTAAKMTVEAGALHKAEFRIDAASPHLLRSRFELSPGDYHIVVSLRSGAGLSEVQVVRSRINLIAVVY